MKTIPTVFKVNRKVSLIMLFSIMIGITSCSKKDDSVVVLKEEVELSDEKQITEFKFLASENTVLAADVIASIDVNAKTISANLPSDIALTWLTPKISVSPKAIVSPTGEKDFTSAVTYTVTAEDGTTNNYAVTATSKSSAKAITSFAFTGIENNGVTVDIPGEIDEEGKTIAMEMPNGTEITALEPELEIPDNAIYEPTGPQDFSMPINYTVTAEDGTSSTYLVTVDVALSQKEILLLIAAANPNNTLNWNETDNLNDWNGVTLDENGFIIELRLNSRNLTVVPAEIGRLGSLQVLWLSFNELSELPSEIGQLSNLEFLELSSNSLNFLPSEFGLLNNLTYLSLTGNDLNSLPSEIGLLSSLTYLTLGHNAYSTIPVEIWSLNTLKTLSFQSNNLSGLPAEIGQLNNLEHLGLSNNELISLPAEIGLLTSLEALYLQSNNLSSLPSEIKKLVNLRHLNLKDNNLSAFNHVPYIPSGSNSNILDCSTETNLTELFLSGNPNLTAINKCICDLDLENDGAVNIDIVPNEVDCVDNNVIGN